MPLKNIEALKALGFMWVIYMDVFYGLTYVD